MADIANLARHLLMTEVLQICESVHKQVEDHKLTVYQKGEVHTVAETVTLITGSADGMEGEAMTVVTHSGQAGASESLAVVSACLAMEQPQVAEEETYVISVDLEEANSSEGAKKTVSSQQQEEQQQETVVMQKAEVEVEAVVVPPKRKRGRPEMVPAEEVPSPDEGSSDKQESLSDDPRRRRLRQRSMAEGGYARLHMGLEEEEEKVQVDEASTKESEPERAVKQLQASSEGAVDGEHTCSECGMSFQRRYSLIMHTLKHEKARGYKCSVSFLLNCGGAVVRLWSMLVSFQLCSKEFQYSASLQAHLARHKQHRSQWGAPAKVPAEHGSQGREDAEANDKTSASATKREFVCDICGKTLPKLYSLRIHMLSHTGVRPHSCKVCGKTFAHKPSLKMHRALHDSAKQFQCEFCSKTFMSKRSMEEHTSLHTGQSRHPSLPGSDDFNRQ
uniref:Zinc finger and BTB domain containing 11 n=1 Tax=Oryzias latipes TaxID=8090 RepID=A0A3P9MLG7_ORYLA